MDGILRCSRYSFGPNRLHYCGPDANRELLAYLAEGASDPGLERIIQGFATLYPYLRLIARANGIEDPFDDRVVEAYWIGNELLENVERQTLFRTLLEDHEIKKKVGQKSFDEISEKIRQGAVPHHSFHVLNVWRRTGHHAVPHTLESMDSCRIGWGEVVAVDGPTVTAKTEPLVLRGGKLAIGEAIRRTLSRALEATGSIEWVKPGDLVTSHWGVACEVVTPAQARTLQKYTLRSIAFMNQTL